MNIAWNIILYGWFASEVLILLATRTRREDGNVRDRGSLLVLWVTITAAVTGSSLATAIGQKNMLAGADWLRTAGIAMFLVGLAIRWTAIHTLGRSFSVNVAVRHDQRVHRTGLFRWVRHPSYLGMMVVFFAIGIHSRNWFSLAIILVLPFVALIYRIHVEEEALADAFGEEYLAYCRVTKRLLPGIY